MPIYYLDSSALIKRYKSEPGSDIVEQLLSSKRAAELFTTSYFTLLEVIALNRRRLKGRQMTRRAYGILVARFLADIGDQMILQSLTNELLDDAISLADRYALKSQDATHLATANAVSVAFLDDLIVLTTADAELAAAGALEGLTVLNPLDTEARRILQSLRA